MRNPTTRDRTARSQNDPITQQLDQSQASYGKRFMNLLEAYPNYMNFSNKAWITNSANAYDSLESIHDQLHGQIGMNSGHMGYVSSNSDFQNHHFPCATSTGPRCL